MCVPSCQKKSWRVFSATPSASLRLSHSEANSCSVGFSTVAVGRGSAQVPARISAWTLPSSSSARTWLHPSASVPSRIV